MNSAAMLLITIAPAATIGCANTSRIRGNRMEQTPALPSRDFSLTATEPSPTYPELIRVMPDGVCVFGVLSEDHGIEVEAAPGEQIPEGDSDFFGSVISSDPKSQTAKIRAFDLGNRITRAEQGGGGHSAALGAHLEHSKK